MILKKNIYLYLFLLIACSTVQAQVRTVEPKDNSPYSSIGLGDFLAQNYAASAGMAGLSAAYNDRLHTNLLNPASYASLQATAFEIGIFSKYAALDAGDNTSADVFSGNLQYLSLAFPLINPINRVLDRNRSPLNWGMNITLQPYTSVGYHIQAANPSEAGELTTTYQGSGGTYRFTYGNGIKYKDIALGINFNYYFGQITNNTTTFFNDLDNYYYANDLYNQYSIGGAQWDLGLQYNLVFKQKDKTGELVPSGKSIVFGLTYSPKTNFKTNNEQYYVRRNSLSPTAILDTILVTDGINGEGTLASLFSFGVVYQQQNKWRLGLDIKTGSWSNYTNEVNPDILMNNYVVALAGEFTPDFASYNSYLKRCSYRLGGFYGTDPRTFNSDQLTKYGVTIGMGLPIIRPRQQTSYVDWALEFGQFGLSDSIKENYIKLNLGFTLNDNTWFFKRKFN